MESIANSEAEQFERIKTKIYAKADVACADLAREISDLIIERTENGGRVVLGLATGSTPVRLYRQLIRMHRDEGLNFKNVHTFNLDDYFGLPPDHPESYRRFMQEQLFQHVNIPPEQIHIPDGMIGRDRAFGYCSEYEKKIKELGGIDLQILGIGRTGHIGFNEPGSQEDSPTRLVSLDSMTRRDAARDFLGELNVPRYAITMGVGTILKSRKVVLLAWGDSKARIVARAVEEPPSDALPASFLQKHPAAFFCIDEAAAADLVRVKHPWRVGEPDWTPELIRKAVIWLAEHTKKPVLKLTDEEYNESGMASLVTSNGPAYDLNIRIFNQLQHSITGWPGGKPRADDSSRPERAAPFPKRSLIFSSEPQDDVLCMGGTINRLVEQGHEVTVVYACSGSMAVPDEEVSRIVAPILEMGREFAGKGGREFAHLVEKLMEGGVVRDSFEPNAEEIRKIKKLIRRGEARAACKTCGLPEHQISFLDLPFYEAGRYRQFFPTVQDVTAVTTKLEQIKPHQIFVTGSLAEPSSVQSICFEILKLALTQLKHQSWVNDCRLWLYRGAGAEWDTAEIEMAVPLSPDELTNKIRGIYQHHSQRSQNPNRSDRHREAWQQAEAINRSTAESYNRLGLAEYEAMEAFKKFVWKEN